ncbi:hypothetical protein [Francisella philomiragia]|uniref:hypothetical protein n=1 Tax=Francisella philomiragia TaxID=28110 RepID=UPI001B8C10F7|nr:hypothetical protein [Francisella philomiragia]QUE31375.1 hypothetical protein IMS64_09210 [Francisella philomiragia]
MNVIEKYVQLFTKLEMDDSLFSPDGPELCPADGTRTLAEYAHGLPKDSYQYIQKIKLKELICKNANVDGQIELHGVARFKLYWKVNQGKAKMTMVQVLHSKNGIIHYLNSFWDFEYFTKLCEIHPELKKIFEK